MRAAEQLALGLEPETTRENPLGRLGELLLACAELADEAGVSVEMFAELAPPPGFEALHVDVYRSHVRELLARYRSGAPLDVATDAEVVLWLSDAIRQAPPDSTHAALFDRVWRRVMGEDAYARLQARTDCTPREPYPGACDEADARIRRQIVTLRERRVS